MHRRTFKKGIYCRLNTGTSLNVFRYVFTATIYLASHESLVCFEYPWQHVIFTRIMFRDSMEQVPN